MRRRPPDRLDRLAEAAMRVFARKGFRHTQMSDVAAELSVSQGTLYNTVRSKEALFYLVIDRVLGGSRETGPLPLPDPAPGAVEARLRERLRLGASLPRLSAAIRAHPSPDGRAELEGIVSELYDVVDRARPAIVMLERSALERPELAQIFYGEMRASLVRQLAKYLTSRITACRLRPVSNPAVTARLLLENVAIFALHRHADPGGGTIDDSAAREAVVDLIVNALAPSPQTQRKRR